MQFLAFCSFGETKAGREPDPFLLTQSAPVPAAALDPTFHCHWPPWSSGGQSHFLCHWFPWARTLWGAAAPLLIQCAELWSPHGTEEASEVAQHTGSSRVPRRERANTLQWAKPAWRCRWIKRRLGDKWFNRTGCAMANEYAGPCQFS